MNNKFITDKELENYGSTDTFSDKAASLLLHQKENWDLVKNNFQNLEQIKTKKFVFDNFELKAQFNPTRIASSSAKVDKKNIKARACFLCKENLPEMQKGIKYKDDYLILVNPFPIFKQHLTIPKLQHIPQSIENSFLDLLDLSYDLKDNFFVFYNGPNCGASAPDHHHFQAGVKDFSPLEKDYKNLIKENGKLIYNNGNIEIFIINSLLRNFIYISTTSKEQAKIHFERIFAFIKKIDTEEPEPKLNIVSFYKNSKWNIFIFPRAKHRPEQYFMEDDNKILFSPAAAEMTGLCILPREEDFNNITKEILIDMYEQVTFPIDKLKLLASLD
jgi:hypothetical protein